MAGQVPEKPRDLLALCERYVGWIKREGFDRDSLQAATDFAGDLVSKAGELHEFLKAELRRKQRASQGGR